MRRKSTWGGRREGAGRPAKGPIPSEPHKQRPPLSSRHPVRITARVVPAVGNLRGARADRAIQRALATAHTRANFRIVYVELRTTKIEMIVEAADRTALARGMQGFQIAAARHLNREAHRRGMVFPDRYRMQILRTRVEVRKAMRELGPLDRAAWPQTWLLRIGERPANR